MKAFIDAIEKLAFEMPPPNSYTPRFVQLCMEARAHMNRSHEAVERDARDDVIELIYEFVGAPKDAPYGDLPGYVRDAMRDAARYRWLRGKIDFSPSDDNMVWVHLEQCVEVASICPYPDLDAWVDAMRQSAPLESKS